MTRCAHCEVEIDYLKYYSDVTEYGNCTLAGDDMDCDNTETQSTSYECPECNHEIDPDNSDDFLEDEEDEEEEKDTTPKDTTKVVKVWKDDMFAEGRYARPSRIMQCKKCEHAFEVSDKETEVECVKCNAKLTSKNLITV